MIVTQDAIHRFGLFGMGLLLVLGAASPATGAYARTDESDGGRPNAAITISTDPALVPTFAADTDYYVTRCSSAPVHVSVTAPNGQKVSVDGHRARTGSFATDVKLNPGEEFVATVRRNGDGEGTYHVRCLPADFPTWTSAQSGRPQASFVVVTPTFGLRPGASPYIAIFDTRGVPRWWKKSTGAALDAQFLRDGGLAWQTNSPAQEFRLDGSYVKTFGAAGPFPVDKHELQVLANGDYLLAVVTSRHADLSPCGGPATGASVSDQQIQELSSDGSLQWSWDTAAHIPISEVSSAWWPECRAGDPYHFNAIEDLGDSILVNFRHLQAVYKISKATGQIVWKLGGTARPDNTNLAVVNDPVFDTGGSFGGQHDIRRLADGTFTLHDNGSRTARAPRAVRYRIDEKRRTATLLEQVVSSSNPSSWCCGSARKLLEGDWVVAWGDDDVEEVTPSGAVVWSLRFDGGVSSYRAYPVTNQTTSAELTEGMNAQYPRP